MDERERKNKRKSCQFCKEKGNAEGGIATTRGTIYHIDMINYSLAYRVSSDSPVTVPLAFHRNSTHNDARAEYVLRGGSYKFYCIQFLSTVH